jgi:hypothetical protein
MFLSVQKIKGKTKKYGYSKGVVTYEEVIGTTKYYRWKYTDEKFERKNVSYKFVVKESYRENGKVKQKQVCLGTYFWYDFVYERMQIYLDWYFERLEQTFNMTDDAYTKLYDKIDKQIDIIESAEGKEWQRSEENRAYNKYSPDVEIYKAQKKWFDDEYGQGYFEQIYDFKLNCKNKPLLDSCDKMRKEKARQAEEKREKEQQEYEQRKKQWENEYSQYFSGSTSIEKYSDTEKQDLKKFYKVLAQKFHPDLNPNVDTTKQMQLLNKLKDSWGV